MLDINEFATPAYPNGDVTLLVVEIERLQARIDAMMLDHMSMVSAMQLALYALEEVTFFVGPQDTPAKVEGTYSDAVDCNIAINALRKFVVPNAKVSEGER